MIRSCKDLDVWKKSICLVKNIYLITKEFPKDEIYGLVSQMRRASISIPSNIAEGNSRQHTNEYIQFLYVALASSSELETQIIICKELSYLSEKIEEELLEEIDHIGKMLRKLIQSLRTAKTESRVSRTDPLAPNPDFQAPSPENRDPRLAKRGADV